MNIEEFNKDKVERENRRHELSQKIKEDEQELKELEQEYENAIMADDDGKADKIYPKLEKLKQAIKRNSFKLDKTRELDEKAIKENAYEAVGNYRKLKEEYEKKAKELDEQMTPIQEEAERLLAEGRKLSKEYGDMIREHARFAETYKVPHYIYNNKDGYEQYDKPAYRDLSPNKTSLPVFKETSIAVGSPTGARNAETEPLKTAREIREERKQSLPDNATLAEIAEANRVIQQ